jgi:hypothetical protein
MSTTGHSASGNTRALHPAMPASRPEQPVRRLAGVCVVLAALAGGCSQSRPEAAPALQVDAFRASAEEISAREEAMKTAAATAAGKGGPSAGKAGEKAGGGKGMPVVTAAQASGGVTDVVAVPASPVMDPKADVAAVGEPAFVDALVGQINGKPVYASAFLAPMDAQLRAEAEKAVAVTPWLAATERQIRQRLEQQVRDELFLAEARASLSSEERQGLINILQNIRQDIARGFQGSEEAATEQLMLEENKDLEAKARDERDKLLIRTLVARQIQPRVNVSWRDVQKEYNRNFEAFNPPPKAVVRMIWASRSNPQAADEIARALAADGSAENFAKLAADRRLNDFSAGTAGLLEPVKFQAGQLAEAKLLGEAVLNDAAVKLAPGQVAGPLTRGNGVKAWVLLERIDQEPGRTLEEAQLEVAAALRERRFGQEAGRFFERLMEQGSKTDERLMIQRLLIIAADRYLAGRNLPANPPGGRPSPAGSPSPRPVQ